MTPKHILLNALKKARFEPLSSVDLEQAYAALRALEGECIDYDFTEAGEKPFLRRVK